MKKIIETNEGSGLDSLLGKYALLLCANYFYYGRVVGVSDYDVQLEGACIVYETGPLLDPEWKDAQRLPGDSFFVRVAAVESYCTVEK